MRASFDRSDFDHRFQHEALEFERLQAEELAREAEAAEGADGKEVAGDAEAQARYADSYQKAQPPTVFERASQTGAPAAGVPTGATPQAPQARAASTPPWAGPVAQNASLSGAGAAASAQGAAAAPAAPYTAPAVPYDTQVQIPNPADKQQLLQFLPEHWKADAAQNLNDIQPGHPPGQGVIAWRDESVNNLVEYGKATGAIPEGGEIWHDAHKTAAAMLGFAPGEQPGGPRKEITPDVFINMLMERIPPDRLNMGQVHAALRFVNDGKDGQEQFSRLSRAILGFQTMDKAGTPPVSKKQMVEELWTYHKIPGHALKYDATELRQKYDEINAIQSLPGKHSVKLRSSRTYKIENDEAGNTTSEKVKKKSFWSKVGDAAKKALPIVLTVLSFIPVTAPFAIAANAALSAYQGVKNGNWLQVAAGIAGAAAGVGGAFAGAAGGAAATAASTASKVATWAGRVQQGLQAYQKAKEGDWLGAVAGAAGAVAGGFSGAANGVSNVANNVAKWANRIQTGAEAYRAAQRGDYLGAVGLAGSLATSFNPNFQDSKLGKALTTAQGGLQAYEAIRKGDYGSAAQLLAGAAAGYVQNDGRRQTLLQAADAVAGVAGAHRAIEQGDYLGAASQLTAAASQWGGLEDGTREKLLRTAQTLQQAGSAYQRAEQGDYLGAASSLTQLAGSYVDRDTRSRWLDAAQAFEQARGVPEAIESGNYLQAAHQLTQAASAFSDNPQLQSRLQQASSALEDASSAYSLVRQGDYGNAAAVLTRAAASFVGDPQTRDRLLRTAGAVESAAGAYDLVQRGDYFGAASALAGAAGTFVTDASTRSKLGRTAQLLQQAGQARSLIERGDYAGAASYLAQSASQLTSNPKVQNLLQQGAGAVQSAAQAYQAYRDGDYGTALNALGDLALVHGGRGQLGRQIQNVAGIVSGIDEARQAIRQGDYEGAAAQLLRNTAGRSRNPQTRARVELAAQGLQHAGSIRRAIDGGDWGSAAKAAGELAGWLRDNGLISRANEVQGAISELRAAERSGDGAAVRAASEALGGTLEKATREIGRRQLQPAGEAEMKNVLSSQADGLIGAPMTSLLTPEVLGLGNAVGGGSGPTLRRGLQDEQHYLRGVMSSEGQGGLSWARVGGQESDGLGLVPGYAEAADLANAGSYARQGEYLDAGFSLLSMIPAIGDVIGKSGRYLARGAGEVSTSQARRILAALDQVDVHRFLAKFADHPTLGPQVQRIQRAVEGWIQELRGKVARADAGDAGAVQHGTDDVRRREELGAL